MKINLGEIYNFVALKLKHLNTVDIRALGH